MNRLVLTAQLVERGAMRYTPAGLPALDLSLFRSNNYRMANLATASFGIAFSAMFLGSVLFLNNVWGYSILSAGLATSATRWPASTC